MLKKLGAGELENGKKFARPTGCGRKLDSAQWGSINTHQEEHNFLCYVFFPNFQDKGVLMSIDVD